MTHGYVLKTKDMVRLTGQLQGYARRSLQADDAIAEDLAQEAFLGFFKSRAEEKMRCNGTYTASNVKSYLFRSCTNRCISEKRKKRPSLLEQLNLISDPNVADRKDDFEELVDHLAAQCGLSDEKKQVLILRFRDDLSYLEIAEKTGVPIGTVMSRIHRAKQEIMQPLMNYARKTYAGDSRFS